MATKIQMLGQQGVKMMCTVALQCWDLGLKIRPRAIYAWSLYVLSCLCGFPSSTLVSSHIIKNTQIKWLSIKLSRVYTVCVRQGNQIVSPIKKRICYAYVGRSVLPLKMYESNSQCGSRKVLGISNRYSISLFKEYSQLYFTNIIHM